MGQAIIDAVGRRAVDEGQRVGLRADADVRITAGEPDLLAVGLHTDNGDVVVRTEA